MTHLSNVPNRLIHEKSPYLLQHAYNPVDWYPWGEEAFQEAKEQDKPIFLSIGYSTCHWCHVMEHESFEDQEVADELNGGFIAIKVDREERPDIDSVYMNVCQELNGSGGWPLTIVMTPDKKPFIAGTYFPKHRRYGQSGLLELLELIEEKWAADKSSLIRSGHAIADEVARRQRGDVMWGGTMNKTPIKDASRILWQNFDKKYGGFGHAPKFPSPHNILFLLHYHALSADKHALLMAEQTLTAMYRGGLFDHAGYGFSRYSTDERWLVPHFEKMIYDNALLAIAYTEAYQITKKELYRYIAERTLEYVKREMTDISGGFYSAQDADSEGEEGKYYTWKIQELADLLGEQDAVRFCRMYGVSEAGNFEGKNILNRLKEEHPETPDAQTEELLRTICEYRRNRYALHKDDKVLTAWNGMMITAFAKAGAVFGNEEYTATARKAIRFIESQMSDGADRLMVSWRKGISGGKGMLDDYAYLCMAYIELYQSTFEANYLEEAFDLMKVITARFADNTGGFFMTPDDAEELVYRPKEFYDGAVPSGNSAAAYCLARLAKISGNTELDHILQKQLSSFAHLFYSQPTASTFALKTLILELYPVTELIGVINNSETLKKLKQKLAGIYQPQLCIVLIMPDTAESLISQIPHLRDYLNHDQGKDTFYFCRNQKCSAPVHDLESVMEHLQQLS